MADRDVLIRTNTKLLAVNTLTKCQAEWIGLQYNSQSACVLSLRNIKKRIRLAEKNKKEKEAKAEEKRQKDKKKRIKTSFWS